MSLRIINLDLAPIFLVGCPRSGTTLLQRMLDAHSRICIAPETHFIRRFWNKRYEYGDLSIDANHAKLLKDIGSMPEFSEMGLDFKTFSTDALEINRTYPNIFALILTQFLSRCDAELVGEKTPNHLLYMPILSDFFPSARFIHIIRDPRSVVNSWRTVPWSTGSIIEDARVWHRYLVAARNNKQSDKVLTLFYEDLVLDSQKSLQTICNFIGINFESEILDFYHQPSSQINVKREPWKQNVNKPVTTDFTSRWQRELSKDMIVEIEAVTASEMKKLGYKFHSNFWDRMSKTLHLKVDYVLENSASIAKKGRRKIQRTRV